MISCEYDAEAESPIEWHIDAITNQACAYLCLDDVNSALDCLEKAEEIFVKKYDEAKALGADKVRLDHVLKEIKIDSIRML